MKTTHDKYWWIYHHTKLQGPSWGCVWIDIQPHMVDPATRCIEDDESRNTHLEFWVECGGTCEPDEHTPKGCTYHDWELDCGGDTWNEAIDNLYKLVLKHYGEYE